MVIIGHYCFPIGLSYRESFTVGECPIDELTPLIEGDSISSNDVSSLLVLVSDNVVALSVDLKTNIIFSLGEEYHLVHLIQLVVHNDIPFLFPWLQH